VIPDQLAEARAALHLDVPCRVCDAKVSEPCRSAGGTRRVQVHAERRAESELVAQMDPLPFAEVEWSGFPDG
jgi:hypothetical protein